jgi:excinuclease ABC subunit C
MIDCYSIKNISLITIAPSITIHSVIMKYHDHRESLEMSTDTIKDKIASAPTSYGVYLFKDSRGRIIYIGKAKNLRNRLKSYSGNVSGLDHRKQNMVKTAHDVSYIVTDNELEALALEANLIKQNRPKYNVLLRDDKNYPYIRIDLNEEWPRIEVVRRIRKDKALHFGPYIPAGGLRETLALIRRHFNIRPCRYAVLDNIKPCVQYQMGRCPAPCGGLISKDEYMNQVNEVINFLQGKNKDLLQDLHKQMLSYSAREMYEEAAKVRDRIAAVEQIWDSQKVVAPRLGEIDIIGSHSKGRNTAFVVLFIRNGLMTGSKEFHLQGVTDIPRDELFHSFVEMMYSNQVIPPSELVLKTMPTDSDTLVTWLSEKRGRCVRIEVPQRGQKKKLVEMAVRNAEVFLNQYKEPEHDKTLSDISVLLKLDRKPQSIGAFDISTIGGASSVGAYVLWENGRFVKDAYRYVNIKNVRGIDDYAMLDETITRIIRNLDNNIPDMILIDGGKGQLDVSRRAIGKLGLAFKPYIIAVAKEPDRVFTGRRIQEIPINNNKPSSLLLRSIRDEVHRFAITRHRKARSGKMLSSVLEEIHGIGKKRRLELLRHFGSIDAIKKASLEDITGLKGFNQTMAKKIKEGLSQ